MSQALQHAPADATATTVLWSSTDVARATVPLPRPRDREILVRLTLATVCPCVRRVVRERVFGGAPTILGHEGVGEVTAVGEGACGVDGRTIAVGDRVVWAARTACGRCIRCRRSDAASCRGAVELGSEPADPMRPLQGSFATHMLLPAEAAVSVVPSWAPDALVSPAGCAVARAAAIVERAGGAAGRRLVVDGADHTSLAVIAMASEAGAVSCTVVDPSPVRRARALEFGADVALDPAAPLPTCDLVVVSSLGGARRALEALDHGGCAVLAGPAGDAVVEIDIARVARRSQAVVAVRGAEPRHLGQAIDFLVSTHAARPWTDLVAAPVTPAHAAALLLEDGEADRRESIAFRD